MNFITEKLKIKRKDIRLFLTILFCFFTSGAMVAITGTLFPFMREEYGIPLRTQGIMLSAFSIGSVAAILVIGFLPYFIGRKKSLAIMFSGTFVGLVMVVLTGNPAILIMSFGLMGIGRGSISNISTVTMTDIAENETGGLNFLHAIFAVGALISPIAITLITKNKPANWKLAAMVIAVMGVVSVIMVISSSMPSTPAKRGISEASGFFKDEHYWINIAALFFYSCVDSTIAGWLVSYFRTSGALSDTVAQLMPSILWGSVLVARLVITSVSTRENRDKLLVLMTVTLLISFVIMINIPTAVAIIIGAMGVGASYAGIYPTVLATMNPKYSKDPLATGSTIALGNLGGIIMPSVIGFIAEKEGIQGGIASLTVVMIILLTIILFKFFYERKNPAY